MMASGPSSSSPSAYRLGIEPHLHPQALDSGLEVGRDLRDLLVERLEGREPHLATKHADSRSKRVPGDRVGAAISATLSAGRSAADHDHVRGRRPAVSSRSLYSRSWPAAGFWMHRMGLTCITWWMQPSLQPMQAPDLLGSALHELARQVGVRDEGAGHADEVRLSQLQHALRHHRDP